MWFQFLLFRIFILLEPCNFLCTFTLFAFIIFCLIKFSLFVVVESITLFWILFMFYCLLLSLLLALLWCSLVLLFYLLNWNPNSFSDLLLSFVLFLLVLFALSSLTLCCLCLSLLLSDFGVFVGCVVGCCALVSWLFYWKKNYTLYDFLLLFLCRLMCSRLLITSPMYFLYWIVLVMNRHRYSIRLTFRCLNYFWYFDLMEGIVQLMLCLVLFLFLFVVESCLLCSGSSFLLDMDLLLLIIRRMMGLVILFLDVGCYWVRYILLYSMMIFFP